MNIRVLDREQIVIDAKTMQRKAVAKKHNCALQSVYAILRQAPDWTPPKEFVSRKPKNINPVTDEERKEFMNSKPNPIIGY